MERLGEGIPDLTGGEHRRQRRPRVGRRRGRVATGVGLAVIVAVGGWQAYATWWTVRSQHGGSALVRHERALVAAAHAKPEPGGAEHTTACTPGKGTSAASGDLSGLLEIPDLDLVAPVEQGTGDSQLSVAVGHDPYSVWPGKKGTAVFLAHDVSYFSHIDQLKKGDEVRFVTPCTTYDFQVSNQRVVASGTNVYNSAGPTLLLGTCWPTDALWYTPDRLLVSAIETKVESNVVVAPTTTVASSPSGGSPLAPHLSVPAPAALVAQGLALSDNSVLLGTMSIAGHPAASWVQSPAPLDVEASALEAYFGGLHALAQDRLDWWAAVAPGVTVPAPLVGSAAPQYESRLTVTVDANGTSPSSIELTASIQVTGGSAPGAYSMTVGETVNGSTLTVSSWRLVAS